MEPSSKKIRVHDEGSSPGEDRLSALPDGLLHAILSSLKADQVLQTSLLSRRWRSLWRSVPCLDVDQRHFSSSRRHLKPQKRLDNFEDLADFLSLNRGGSPLDTFRLWIYEGDAARMHADRWVRRALGCSLRALHVCGYRYNFPPLRMALDYLGLGASTLTTLHLSYVYLDARFAESIRSVCVVLEDLKLKGCDLCFHNIIASVSLRSLVVETRNREPDNHRLSITAPGLTSLRLIIWDPSFRVSVHEMLSLEEATIRYSSPVVKTSIQDTQRKLLSNVCNVTSLELRDFLPMMARDMEPFEFPTFENLQSLLLVGCDLTDNFQLLRHFLQKSPNLEKLTLQYCWFRDDFAGEEGMATLKKLKCTEIIYKHYQYYQKLVCFSARNVRPCTEEYYNAHQMSDSASSHFSSRTHFPFLCQTC